MERNESGSEAVQRASVIARIIAILGDAKDREFATEYYKFLVQKIETQEDFDYLIELHMSLGLGAATGEIRKKFEEMLASRKPKSESDQQGRVAFVDFQANVNRKISGAEQILGSATTRSSEAKCSGAVKGRCDQRISIDSGQVG